MYYLSVLSVLTLKIRSFWLLMQELIGQGFRDIIQLVWLFWLQNFNKIDILLIIIRYVNFSQFWPLILAFNIANKIWKGSKIWLIHVWHTLLHGADWCSLNDVTWHVNTSWPMALVLAWCSWHFWCHHWMVAMASKSCFTCDCGAPYTTVYQIGLRWHHHLDA